MISLTSLTERIEKVLNKPMDGVINPATFKLFTDTGKFKRSVRKGNMVHDVINGLMTVTSSDISNTNDGLIVGTLTNRLELLVKCKDNDENVYQPTENGEILVELGNDDYIRNIRSWLDSFCAKAEYFNQEDEEDKTIIYNVSAAYSFVSSGVRQQNPIVGDSYSFIIYAYYNVIQGGENSRQWTAFLDGERIPFSNITLRRVPTQETFIAAQNGINTKNVTTSHTFGASFECPSFIGLFNDTIKNYLLNGERNVAHFLTLTLGNDVKGNKTQKTYLVVFGEVDGIGQGVLNVGQTITFAETSEDYGIFSFPQSFYVYHYTGNKSSITALFDGDNTLYDENMKKPFTAENSAELDLIYGNIVASLKEIKNAEDIGLERVQNG